MSAHEEFETLSAYLDLQVGAGERARIEAHLAACGSCREDLEALDAASSAVAALEKVAPTEEEVRALRRAVRTKLQARPFWRTRAALAGAGAAALAAAALVVGVIVLELPDGGRQAASEGELGAQPSPPESFSSEEELRRWVLSDPAVAEGLQSFTVADVGADQQHRIAALGRQEDESGGATGVSRQESAEDPAPASETEPDEAGASLQSCLTEVVESWPYPTMPLVAAPIHYQETPSYLFVFAWSDEPEADAPLNRLQVWVMRSQDCFQLLFFSTRD